MLNHPVPLPAGFDPCRKCGAMAWVRVQHVERIALRCPSVSQVDDDMIERWNCPCGNVLTWGHPKAMEAA